MPTIEFKKGRKSKLHKAGNVDESLAETIFIFILALAILIMLSYGTFVL